jgi:hypothetical protein
MEAISISSSRLVALTMFWIILQQYLTHIPKSDRIILLGHKIVFVFLVRATVSIAKGGIGGLVSIVLDNKGG